MDELFETYNRKGNFVAGVVIEPVQAEGGDHHGSPAFFQVSRSQNSPSSEKKRCGAGLIGSSVFFCWCSGPASADAQTRRGADRRRGADGRRRLGQILVPRTLRSAQTGRPRHLQQEDAHWWILQFARVQVAHHPDPFRCQSRVPAVADRLSLRDGLLSCLGFFLFGFKTACQLVSNWNETTSCVYFKLLDNETNDDKKSVRTQLLFFQFLL